MLTVPALLECKLLEGGLKLNKNNPLMHLTGQERGLAHKGLVLADWIIAPRPVTLQWHLENTKLGACATRPTWFSSACRPLALLSPKYATDTVFLYPPRPDL